MEAETTQTIESTSNVMVANLAKFNTFGESESTKSEYIKTYIQYAFKYLIEMKGHIEAAKRAEKRLAELPALIEAKLKEIEAFSSSAMPQEYHKKENRDKVKALTEELGKLEAEQAQFPEDIKFKLQQADLSSKNFEFNLEQVDLVKSLI